MSLVRSLSGALVVGCFGLGAGLLFTSYHATSAQDKPAVGKLPAKRATEVEVEIRCMDDSVLKVKLPVSKLEFSTRYGVLQIPASEIQGIDFAHRCPPAVAEKVTQAASKLGHTDFEVREAATEELKSLRYRAYPVVKKLMTNDDPEVSRRAEEIVKFIEGKVPSANLEFPEFDVIHTEHSKIAGRLTTESLTVITSMFGEQSLKLSDVRTLRSGHGVEELDNTIPAPANMDSYGGQYGKVFTFKLTAHPAGTVWGTNLYTLDSSLPAAALHAGALKPGETGTVRVRIVQTPQQFVASQRNGVTSTAYGPYSTGAFEFIRK